MLLLNDIVEIHVRNFPNHGGSSGGLQEKLKSKAATRLFGLLPQQQGDALLSLWQEFERAETEDAEFAKALDRFQPLLINVFTGGGTWTESGVSLEQVFSRYEPAIKQGGRLFGACASDGSPNILHSKYQKYQATTILHEPCYSSTSAYHHENPASDQGLRPAGCQATKVVNIIRAMSANLSIIETPPWA